MDIKKLILLIGLLFSLTSVSHAALSDGTQAYWKMDESSGDAADATGNGNTAVSTSVTYSAGKINNGANYNGSAFHTVTDNSTIEPVNAISIAAWVKISSLSSYQMLLAKGESAGDTQSYEIRTFAATSQIEVQMRAGGGAYIQYRTTTAIGTGSWVHVVATRNGTTNKIYINGVSDTLAANTTNAGNIDYSTGNLWLGQRNGGLRFNGSLDEIGLWNRELSAAEVAELYNGGTGIQYPFSTVMAPITTPFFRFFKRF